MKLLITEDKNFSTTAFRTLNGAGFNIECGEFNYYALQKVVHNYDGLIIRLGIRIDREMIDAGKRLRFIATSTTGLDHIDLDSAKKRNIEVISLKGERSFLDTIPATAELTWALLLNATRKVGAAEAAVSRGEWERDKFVGRDLRGKTLGIVGLGRLGSMVASYGTSFGMDVIYYDPRVRSLKYKKAKRMDELAAEADVISVHVGLDETTVDLLDVNFFRACQKNPIIINTSRGEVIDETAIIWALETGKIRGVAADVVKGEIIGKASSSRLVDYSRDNDHIIVTPHIGGATEESMRKTEEFIAKKIIKRWGRGLGVTKQ